MSKIKTPKEFFGKQPGADRVMIRWDELCAYYRELATLSDRMLLEEMGKTSEGNDFLILYVSAPENLARLEEYRGISMALADPRGLEDSQIDALAARGKCIVFQSYGLHSNEVGGPQMVPHMLYELLVSDAPRIKKILDEVIFIISPCSEPDGEIVFTDWYYKYFGTEFEGICSPYMRHNWTGHANNRDALRECVVESRYLNDILIRRFMPQIFQDHHHQCPDENRMSISPKCDPISPHISPLVHRETALYGSHMAFALSAAGRRGVVAGDPFFNDFPISSFYGASCLHNIAGMLTENADVRIATPLYIDRETLKLNAREHVTEPCAACPDPWEGGWWHLGDIVEQMYLASTSLLEYAADNRVQILRGMATKALLQTARGEREAIKGYLLSRDQHDPSALSRLLEVLENQRVEMHVLAKDEILGGTLYPSGSVYVSLAQPKYAVVKTILSEEPYSHWAKRDLEQGKLSLGDTGSVCMTLPMGVRCDTLAVSPDAGVLLPYQREVRGESMRGCENASYRTVNRLLASGTRVGRDAQGDFTVLDGTDAQASELRRARVGLLKVSFTGNEEEAFTRNLLREYGFDYRIVMDREIRETGIPSDIDVMIFPAHPPVKLCFGDEIPHGCPPEYQTGLGMKGREHVRHFVESGGRLVTWGKACGVINEWLSLGLVDLAEGLTREEYLTGGSQIHAQIVRTDDPLTCGMARHFTVTHNECPILVPTDFLGKSEILAKISEGQVLCNGVARGEERLRGTPCVLRTHCGKGEVVLYTFSPQFRVQQENAFKLLFNALYL